MGAVRRGAARISSARTAARMAGRREVSAIKGLAKDPKDRRVEKEEDWQIAPAGHQTERQFAIVTTTLMSDAEILSAASYMFVVAASGAIQSTPVNQEVVQKPRGQRPPRD